MNNVALVEDFVTDLFKDKLSSEFTYHNINHTLAVVSAANDIATFSNVDDNDKEIVLIAAWFHDTGYVYEINNHEAKSAEIAQEFLLGIEYAAINIDKVVQLILATKINYIPKNKLEEIICDADYYHFGNNQYFHNCENLRNEWKLTQNKNFTDLEWLDANEEMLTNCHQYHTDYAIKHWQATKKKNIKKIVELKRKIANNMKENNESKKNKSEDRSERSIDTMFKITLTNHIRLSEIADSKANILLSVNAIIISIALSTLIPKLDSPNNMHLIFPTFVMVFFSVISIIFAILSTKPKVTSGKFTRQDIEDKKVNLLFFGNFFKMPYEEFEWAMNEMIKDKNYLHNSMTKDLYYLGLVLERKYRLLRMTYNIFMIGIIVSVIAFVLAFRSYGS